MSQKKLKYTVFRGPLFWGVLITLVFVALIVYLGSTPYCAADVVVKTHCVTKFNKFLNSSPNEIGDTLAGIAGALAFLWIIVTVLLQSQELNAQRKELAAQREELKLTRQESEKMVGAMERQAAIFEDELQERKFDRIERELEHCVRVFLIDLERASKFLTFHIFEKNSNHSSESTSVDFKHEREKSIDQNMDIVLKKLKVFCARSLKEGELELGKKCAKGPRLGICMELLEECKIFEPSLSAAQKTRFENMNILEIMYYLNVAYNIEKKKYNP